jgi:hypothetical protein
MNKNKQSNTEKEQKRQVQQLVIESFESRSNGDKDYSIEESKDLIKDKFKESNIEYL